MQILITVRFRYGSRSTSGKSLQNCCKFIPAYEDKSRSMSATEQRSIYEFGPFRVDVLDQVLTREQQVVPLNLKTFQILLALLENAGKVLTKDVLMRKIWPDTFVEEGNLTKDIFVLRKALGERPDGRPWIETFPKRGYRFTVSITAFSDAYIGGIVRPEFCVPASLPAPRN